MVKFCMLWMPSTRGILPLDCRATAFLMLSRGASRNKVPRPGAVLRPFPRASVCPSVPLLKDHAPPHRDPAAHPLCLLRRHPVRDRAAAVAINRNLHVFIVAGEPSGDVLGADVMREMRLQAGTAGQVRFTGVGGDAMVREGLKEIFPMSELAVMGITELLPHLPRLWRRLKETVRAVEDSKPDILLTIDFKGFNFRLLKRLEATGTLKRENITTVHYVGPSVWAYKRDPTKTLQFLKKHIDQLLLLYPFETAHFSACLQPVCVGAPILELPAVRGRLNTNLGAGLHSGTGAGAGGEGLSGGSIGGQGADPTLLMLPGSRKQEVTAHVPIILAALRIIQSCMPGRSALHVNILTLPSLYTTIVHLLAQYTIPENVVKIRIITAKTAAERVNVMKGHTCAVAVSGSVSMELGAAEVPAVIIYRANWITGLIAKHIAAVAHVGLPNILLGRTLVPELLFEKCVPEAIAHQVLPLLIDQDRRLCQIQGFAEVLSKCQEPTKCHLAPSRIAAEAILKIHASKCVHKDA